MSTSNASGTRETTIEADPSLPTVLITREFDAPVERVYRAHVDPELAKQWMGPRSIEMDIKTWDMRMGGEYRYTAIRDGEEIAHFYGSVHRVDAPQRIVQTFGFDEMPDAVSLDTMTFVDLGHGRTRLEGLSVVYSMEARDGILASGMEVGIKEGYDALDELLSKGSDMATAASGPAQQHAYDASRFTELVESATPGDWTNPSPVAEWTALDVVRHLIEWPRGLLAAGGIGLPTLDIDADPVAAWKQHVTDIQAILDDPAGRALSNPNFGHKPVDEALNEIYTPDVWMHSWDLASALGRDFDLDDGRCTAALAAAAPMEDAMRGSGHFGPKVEVPADARAQDRMLGFIGRDPGWRAS